MLNRRFRFAISTAALIVAFSAAVGVANGQDITVSVQSVDRVLDDLGLVVDMLASNDGMAKDFRRKLDRLQDPALLKGIDRTRSLGIIIKLTGAQGEIPIMAAPVPITNFDDFLALVPRAFDAQIQATDKVPGFSHLLIMPNRQNPAFVTSNDRYAFLSLVPAGGDALKALQPTSGEPSHEGAGEISATMHLDKIPDAMQDRILKEIEANMAASRKGEPGEDDAHRDGRLLGLRATQDAFTALLREWAAVHADLDMNAKARGEEPAEIV